MKARLKTLGEHNSDLIRSSNANKPETTIVNRLMREMLPNVHVLGPFTAADDVVAPFDAQQRLPRLACATGVLLLQLVLHCCPPRLACYWRAASTASSALLSS
jgi:hypothetical protein